MTERQNNSVPVHSVPFEEEVHLRDYFNVLQRRWKSFLSVFASILLLTAIYTFGMTPIYEAETLLQVGGTDAAPALLGELADITAGSDAVEAEMEILRSRSLVSEVIRVMGLDISVSDRSKGLWTRLFPGSGGRHGEISPLPVVADLAVPADLLGEELDLVLDSSGSYTLTHRKKGLASGNIGSFVKGQGIEIEVRAEPGADVGGRYALVKRDVREATEDLIDKLSVTRVGRKSNVVRITYRDRHPGVAVQVLETLNRLYINRDVQQSSREAIATLDFITGQVSQVRKSLEEAQGLLDDYKVQTGAVALSQEALLLVQRISDMEVEINRLKVQRQTLASLLEKVAQGDPAPASGIAALDAASPDLAALIATHSEMLRRREELLAEFTPSNPAVRNLDAQISLVSGQIVQTGRALLESTVRREEAVKGVLSTYRKQLSGLPEVERTLAGLEKNVLIQEKIYSFLLEKEQEIGILKASTVSSIRIVDPPVAPMKPAKPKVRVYMLLGLVLGLVVGVGFVLFQEYLDDTIKDSEEAETLTGVPIYGSIPFVKKAHERRKKKKPHLVIEEPHSPVAEAFRTLRTNIFFSRAGDPPRIITVTSSEPGDGKSFVVANLGALASITGRKTLVLDCDLRHPQQQIVFGDGKAPGITDVLTGKSDFEDAVRETRVQNLHVMHSGVLPPNPAELLGSEEMMRLLEHCRKDYDLVLIDSPPVGVVTDASLLLRRSDLGLLVVMAQRTPLGHVRRGVALVRSQVPDLQLGLVLNGVKVDSYYRYYSVKR